MAKIAYLDCPTGIAGDMCLAALVGAGLPMDVLQTQLGCLGLTSEYRLEVNTVHRRGQAATQVKVHLLKPSGQESHPRHLPDIEQIIQTAPLSPRVKTWSLAIFRRLAQAEASVHGIAPEQVHFHEVGATDALVDIVGCCIGFDWLDLDELHCSALPTGSGRIRAAHGQLPVPAPAVLQLMALGQVPVYSNGLQKELVTPTGVAIATILAQQFGPPPAMTLQKIGLGAGGHDLPLPNILRLWVGNTQSPERPTVPLPHTHQDKPSIAPSSELLPQSSPTHPAPKNSDRNHSDLTQSETIIELQTQLDDINPQAIGYLYDKLFTVGAVEVFTQAISMKKSRPGILITVLCSPDQVLACETELFKETSTLGIRRTQQQRQILFRDWITVKLSQGSVRIKIARRQIDGPIVNIQPEYEDCAQLAQQTDRPWKQIYQQALSEAYRQLMNDQNVQSERR